MLVARGAVIGVPDESHGEEIKAFVILNDGAQVSGADLVAWSKEQMAAFDAGDNQGAVDKFAAFTLAYPGSPLTEEANFDRGEALAKLGRTADAARAYLDAFSSKPDGPFAPDALLKLGQSLGTLGQVPDACVTLTEVGNRFPGTPAATNAKTSMQGLGCL